ncbi:MAG: type II toxin-antitoxin system YafQ family toxin [Rickettsiales bacterium]|nr:type II toxin-antitoxin system YafQ family toxin [Rickettsiales bacterium]
MKRSIIFSNRFKKEYGLMIKRGKDIKKLKKVIEMLENFEILPLRLKDHNLVGDYSASRELHIEPDWLLIYQISKNELILERTGTHADLFKK